MTFDQVWSRVLQGNDGIEPGSSVKIGVEAFRTAMEFAYNEGAAEAMVQARRHFAATGEPVSLFMQTFGDELKGQTALGQ